MSKGDYTYSHVYDMSTQFTSTLALGLVGSFAFVVGYEVVKFRARPSAYRPSKVASSLPRLSTVYRYGIFVSVLSALAYAIHLARGGGLSTSLRTLAAGDSPDTSRLVESSSEYLSAAPILVACAGIIIAASIQHLNRFQKAIVVAASLYPTVLFFLLGNRRFIIPSILIPVIASYFMSGRRPRRLTLLVVAPLTFLLVATIPYARTSGAREQAGGTAPIYQKALARPADVWDRFIGGVDTAMLPALGIELDTLKRPSDFYLGQASVGDVFLAPIPHVLFPSKPVTARNDMLIRSFGVPCSRAGCADFSIIGTFYQDGWWVGVGLGMLLVGVASGWVWRRRLEAPSDPRRVVVAATTAVFLPIIFRAGFMPSFTWFLMFLVPSLVGLELACRQRPGQSATPRATAR
ncbi:MAG: O-antigen polymerase [Actinomycetota bacterium]